jgi:hypothetical protein
LNTFEVLSGAGALRFRSLELAAWNLQGVLPFQRWIVDLKLDIEARDNVRCDGLELVVPFELLDRESVEDLASSWNDKAKPLPDWFSQGSGEEGSTIARPFVVKERPDVLGRGRLPAVLSRRTSVRSVVPIHFEAPLEPGARSVVFLRFHVGPRAAFVLWKRSLFGINGLIVDLQVAAAVEGRAIIQPESCSIHVIVRAYLQPKFTFPSVEPSLVEQGAWQYLRRVTDLRGEGALVRFSSTSSLNEPGRLYLDLSREFGLLPLGNFVRVFIAAALGTELVLALRDGGSGLFTTIGSWISDLWSSVQFGIGPIAVSGVLGVFLLVVSRIPVARRSARATRARLRRLDRYLLESFHRLRSRDS